MVCNIHITSRVKGQIMGIAELLLTTSFFAKTTVKFRSVSNTSILLLKLSQIISLLSLLSAMPQVYSNCPVLPPLPPTVFTNFPSELNLYKLYDSTLWPPLSLFIAMVICIYEVESRFKSSCSDVLWETVAQCHGCKAVNNLLPTQNKQYISFVMWFGCTQKHKNPL